MDLIIVECVCGMGYQVRDSRLHIRGCPMGRLTTSAKLFVTAIYTIIVVCALAFYHFAF